MKTKIRKYRSLKSLFTACCRQAGVFKAKAAPGRVKWMSRWVRAYKVSGSAEGVAYQNAMRLACIMMQEQAVGAFVAFKFGDMPMPVRGAGGRTMFYMTMDDAFKDLEPHLSVPGKKRKIVCACPTVTNNGRWTFPIKKNKK